MRKEERGASVYVIDEAYRLVYFNEALHTRVPDVKLGDYCYQALCGEMEPCGNCPLKKKHHTDQVLYNRHLKQWNNIHIAEGEWPEAGACHVVMLTRVEDEDANLVHNLAGLSSYDAVLELNLSKDVYRRIYHVKLKHGAPTEEKPLRSMIARTRETMIHPQDRDRHQMFWDADTLLERLEGANPAGILRNEFREKNQDGTWRWVQQMLVLVQSKQTADTMVMCFLTDVVLEHPALQEKEAAPEPRRDPLTGMYRESAFFEKAKDYINRMGVEPCCMVAVDIEHFRLFNQWYGRDTGDRLLQEIAEYFKSLHETHVICAGYMGADNFAFLMPNHVNLLNDIVAEITQIIQKYGDAVGFSPAFGIYLIEDRTVSLPAMYDRATVALLHVVGNYAKRVCYYDPYMTKLVEDELHMISAVKNALASGDFLFYAQPKYNMFTGKIVGAEALVRWRHKERGWISPGEFLPILEKNGFITDLDRYVWEEVCRWQRNWLDRGGVALPISVNVSRIDIFAMDVPAYFNQLVEKYRLPKELLQIEITESAYMECFSLVKAVVLSLRKSGFKVLIDDFGSGYSSLNMLKDVAVDVLKLDMKFLDMSDSNKERGVSILSNVIDMAHTMKLPVIAEGVETQEQAETLMDMGCGYAQGYHFFRPMSTEDYERLLSQAENISMNEN